MIAMTVDGRTIQVPEEASILDAINRLGISLPQLCKDPDRPAIGACRTCLVEVAGQQGVLASCATPVREGMVVSTNSARAIEVRRGVLELTAGMVSNSEVGQLGEAAASHRVNGRFRPISSQSVDNSKSFFVLDRDLCIKCGRCTSACGEVQHIGAISLFGRGAATKVGVFGDRLMSSSICTSCGQCVATCPTGALRPKRSPGRVTRTVETTCPYCGVGCGILLRIDDHEQIASVDDVPANRSAEGMLCVKGRFGIGYVHSDDRITTPLIRRDGQLRPASWDEALDLVAQQFAKYRGRFAAFGSAKATNEDGYVLQKFVRTVMGSNSVDHCTRLCHSPSVEAMLDSLGSGATSNSYVDYERAGCLMVVGSDTSSNHPVIAVRIRKAVTDHGAKLIVVNPKRIDLCNYADLWLRQRPGTDVALFNGLAHVVIEEGLADEPFIGSRTEGYQAWRESLRRYTPDWVGEVTGVPAEELVQAARTFARPPFSGSCLIWGMGITQHTNGTANAHSLLNLALVTGQVGKSGNGISPLRGQNNVQGCGDSGCIPDFYPGYQRLTDPAIRAKFERAWGVALNPDEGLRVTEVVEAAFRGEIQAMYVTGENPLLSEPNLNHAEEAFRRLDFLVVQDIFLHETAAIADVVLPASTFAEKDGTFTNSERRVQRIRKAIPAVGQSRPDWDITAELARRTAVKLGFQAKGFDYQSAAEIFDEMARLTPQYAGMSYPRLEGGGIQWPCPSPDHPGTANLYAESFPRGLGKFVVVEQGPAAAELPDREYPFFLNTGRNLYHWHGGTITRHVPGLVELAPRIEVAIHPESAATIGVSHGDPIRVLSRRGTLAGYALVTENVRPGEVFVPFVKLQDSAANFLTNSVYDPDSHIPEYKVCAVRVEAVTGTTG